MKSLFIAILFALGISTASATDIKVNPAVLQSFQKSYSQAKNVSWSKVDQMYKVSFTIDNSIVYAFYSQEGVLSAATRYIAQDQLSLVLQTDLKKHLDGFRVNEIFEVNNESGTTYYATLVSGNKMVVLESSVGNWRVYKKTKL